MNTCGGDDKLWADGDHSSYQAGTYGTDWINGADVECNLIGDVVKFRRNPGFESVEPVVCNFGAIATPLFTSVYGHGFDATTNTITFSDLSTRGYNLI